MQRSVEHLLCPVPVAHIPSAIDLAATNGGRVAFASGAPDGGGYQWQFFESVPVGTPVLIYVSQDGLSDENRSYMRGPAFSFGGTYGGYGTNESDLVDLRPPTTVTDTGWQVFWIVNNFAARAKEDRITFAMAGLTGLLRKPVLKMLM